jgi:hypothetical protein
MWISFGIWLGAFSLFFFSFFCGLLLLECYIQQNEAARSEVHPMSQCDLYHPVQSGLLGDNAVYSSNHFNIPLCTDIYCALC